MTFKHTHTYTHNATKHIINKYLKTSNKGLSEEKDSNREKVALWMELTDKQKDSHKFLIGNAAFKMRAE